MYTRMQEPKIGPVDGNQGCGSGSVLFWAVFRIQDVYPGSECFPSRICIKEFKYFNPKNCFLSSRKYDPGCSSRIRIFYPSKIPDPGVKKAPDPESGSTTLILGAVPHLSEKLDPNPHESQHSGVLGAQNGSMEVSGPSQWRHAGSK